MDDYAINNHASQRIYYIDVFRGIGIILMIMGHIGFGGNFDHFIHAFHMPMFFFISGFFFRKRDCRITEYIVRKAKSLLIPYISFGFAHYLAFLILNGFSIKPLIHLFTINTYDLPIAGALWFLTALFFTDIIFFLLDIWDIRWLIIPLVLVGSYADQLLPYPMPWAISASFVGLGLYWFGKITREYEAKLNKLLNMNWWQIFIVGVLTSGLIFVNGYINMREGRYNFLPLFWSNALLSIFLGISISKKICKGSRVDWLISIGRNSIVYVCLNQIVIRAITKLLRYVSMPVWVAHLLILVMSIFVLYWLSLVFTKTKLKIFIGK